MSFTPSRPMGYACLILSMSLVGAYVALSKPLVAALPMFLLAWLRFGIGAIAMLRWMKKPPGEQALSPQSRWLLFLESFLGNFLFSICMITGVSMTSAVSAGVIMSAIPAVVALMSWIFLKERIGARVWGAIACGVLGIGMLSLAKNPHAASGVAAPHDAWIGNLFVFGAVLCEAAYAVIGKKLTSVLSPKRISAIINLWGLLLMTPMGLYLALQFDFGAVSIDIWALLLFYGLAASVWTVWLWMTGLKVVPAGRAGVFTVMLPISTAIVGVVALGESLSWLQASAFAVALAGMLLATAPTRSAPTLNQRERS
ncbi:DMT family transporter [Herbaspirillum sp. alder98]|uniref:DMT family transporter n=1 Tax=Herbaspirillum sp. alder98 TaxID=2913096 RepID=UPI001CD8C54A|nr:DMT family transporter [Herbaspirillum sp. alder98]MCA1327016.1 DMT family transporter [Herbaspirillum sp. alder98]